MKELKALKVLERIFDDNCYIKDEELDEAIKELEELNSRSCDNCKHISRPFKDNAKGCNILNIWLSNDFYCSKYEPKQ